MVFLDMQIDSGTPIGEMMLNMSACFAQLARTAHSDRVIRGIARKKRQGHKFGKPSTLTRDQMATIKRMWLRGMSPREIGEALGLNRRRVWLACRRKGLYGGGLTLKRRFKASGSP